MGLKILFSPSESKNAIRSNERIQKDGFIFPKLFDLRLKILNEYNDFLKTASDEKLCKLFGFKNLRQSDTLRDDIFAKGCIKAVLRYDGVAYKHLDYRSLEENSKKYIDENVLIFSNLFGPISASDPIPEYKLKQGEKIGKLNIEKFYNENFSRAVDSFLQNDDILDLRAGFYEKFYDIKREYITFKFLKNGKILSHHAKAYRGKILKEISKNKINDKNGLARVNFENLRLIDIKKIGLKTEFAFEINEQNG
ncbi:MAG: YaaA family protein [Campylobacter sp.]|nr:YaaA family protein [Campylobacter sp.]